MRSFKLGMVLLALGAVGLSTLSSPAAAQTVITFDSAQGNYVPGTPGTTQEITDQFAPLGVIFSDVSTPGRGAVVGKCGPGEGSFALFGFGNNGSCGDYTPNIDISFVDLSNSAISGYTTSFSIYNYDGLVLASAYDAIGNLLGTTSVYTGLLAFSDIGNISRVNLASLDQDPTTLDTLTFGQVFAVTSAVPEPSTWAMLLIGFGAVGYSMRRRRRAVPLTQLA